MAIILLFKDKGILIHAAMRSIWLFISLLSSSGDRGTMIQMVPDRAATTSHRVSKERAKPKFNLSISLDRFFVELTTLI